MGTSLMRTCYRIGRYPPLPCAHGGYEVDSRSFYGPGLGAFIAESAEAAARSLPK